MKKTLIILILSLVSCTKVEVIPTPSVNTKSDIFSVQESTVTNNQDITFKLTTAGFCTLTISNSATGQVITREKISGVIGENKIKIYTNSLPKGYLLLVLEDNNKNQLGKTTIINN